MKFEESEFTPLLESIIPIHSRSFPPWVFLPIKSRIMLKSNHRSARDYCPTSYITVRAPWTCKELGCIAHHSVAVRPHAIVRRVQGPPASRSLNLDLPQPNPTEHIGRHILPSSEKMSSPYVFMGKTHV